MSRGRIHPANCGSALTGRSLIAAHRRGKTIWLETSGTGGAAAPGGPELGIHLGMSGRIVVAGPDGSVTEGGDPRRYGARPGRARWRRFTIRFADGGSLVLLDPRRLGGSGSTPISPRSGRMPVRSRRQSSAR